MRLQARPEQRGADLFYLRFDGPELTIYFGPFLSEDILKRYYDPYGRWLDEDGNLDSVSMKLSKAMKLSAIEGNVFAPPEQWERAKELAAMAGYIKEESA